MFKSNFERKRESAKNEKNHQKLIVAANFGATIPMRFASSKKQKTMELLGPPLIGGRGVK